MATVDFTLEELQDGVREIVREEIAPIRTEITELRGGLGEVVGELTELRSELHQGLADVRGELQEGLKDVWAEIRSVKNMLSGDYVAEVGRLSRTSKRLLKLRREFDLHVAQSHTTN